MAAQPRKVATRSRNGSTQKFLEIEAILDTIVLLKGGNACLIIEVQATNFALLSIEEQQSKIISYASLLNSLSFSIQILIRNKKIDISSYIKSLDKIIETPSSIHEKLSTEQNQALINYIELYRDFVQELVKANDVLDKRFYLILSYSSLEQGLTGTTAAVQKGMSQKQSFAALAKASLTSKAESILSQLTRMSLRSKVLEYRELVQLFYDIYNQLSDDSLDITQSVSSPVILGGGKT